MLVGEAEADYTAVVWNEAQGWHSIPRQGAFQPRTAAGTNYDGSIIVGYGEVDGSRSGEPFRWTAAGGLERFGALDTGGAWGFVAVSADGSTMGGDFESPDGYQGFHWTTAGGLTGVGDLPGGEFYSYVRDMSEDGTTIVGMSVSAIDQEAYIWTQARGIQSLVGRRSSAGGVSGDGSIIVGDIIGQGGGAFVWTEETGARLLTSVLSDAGVTVPSEGLSGANAISSDGRFIVCETGRYAYLITLDRSDIPEPHSALILLTLAAAMTPWRYLRR